MLFIALTLLSVAPQAATPPPATDPRARVCRRIKAPTGSRLGSKQECRTAAEWAELDRIEQNNVDAMRARTSRQTG